MVFSVYSFAVCFLVGSVFAAPESLVSTSTSRYEYTHYDDADAAHSTIFSWSSHQSNENGFFPNELADSIKQLTGTIEKSFKGFTQNAGWIFHTVDAIVRTTFEKGFVNVATWAMDIITRFEFLTMADGSHFVFPLSGKSDLEQEYKAVAVAVSKLLRHLKYMERTDILLTNVTRTLLSGDVVEPHYFNELKQQNSLAATEKMLRTLMHSYFETLDRQFELDDKLGAEYKKQKVEAKAFVKHDPKMGEPLFKLWDESRKPVGKKVIRQFLQDKEVLREAYANKLFMKQAVKHLTMIYNTTHYTRYLFARATIQKAQNSPYDSVINKEYHQALVRAGEMQYVDAEDEVIADVLFGTIEQSLASKHAQLYHEIQILMKEIESSTSYDISMLRVDFAPL